MKGLAVLGLGGIVLLGAAGCSTHPAVVNYDSIGEFALRAAPFEGKELGEVKGRHRAYVWEGCTYAARTAVWKMIREAKQYEANAIGDITWRDGRSPEPRCKKRWFYTLLTPVLLTPYFMDAEVRGTAYMVDEMELGLYLIPDDPAGQAELVERIVEETIEMSPAGDS
ncbi:MAG: hypothetical protein ABIK65_09545 [Candidatus Eisenbacteria bacterium]